MASDVLITPASGLIQFSSSAGSGSGQIKVDGDDLVISNVLGDVLLGDGASDVFIGNGTDNVDIVFEQNGEIRDDASGKSITLGSKTTNILISGSNTIAMQKGGGNVGIGKTAATKTLEVEGDISGSGTGSFGNLISTTIEGTLADSSRTDINSILATDLVLGEDAQTKIDFETVNEIHFDVNNAELLNLTGAKISGSGVSTGSFGHIIGTTLELPNDSIPIAQLASDAITIAGSSTALGGSITADTIAGQISADTISGNQINGGTIGSVTITALAGALSLGDNNITNVGDINADSISVDAAGTGLNIDFSGGDTTKNKITLQDDLADALNITEGSNSYIKFTTTDSSEKILVSKDTDFLGNVSGSGTSTGSFGRVEAANIGDVSLSGATLFGTGLKLGRDSTDLIDFASADNTIRFRVNNSDEMNLVSDSLKPHSNDGLALGASNRQWSDLFLAEGAVINFDNGDVTLTQTNNVLAVAGTTDTTFVGNISASGDLDVKHRLFDTGSTQLGAVGGGIGDVINIGDTSTVPGAIYQLQGGGTWALTDADAAASASGSIAVALGANSTTNGMLLRGLSKLNHDPGGLVGAPVYLAVAAGSSSNAVPSGNGDIARVVGYNIDTSGMIYFNPDNTFVEVSA